MGLPVPFDLQPMLAAVQADLPTGDSWSYEPKWDGFRTLVYRDGADIRLASRGQRDLTRYFPEVVAAFAHFPAERVVLDGEIILIGPDGLDFDALQQRLHPADSRVRMLSEKTPASFVAFDALGVDDEDLRTLGLGARRERLEELLGGVDPPLYLTPYTRSIETGREWLAQFEGAGLDGVIAKNWEQPYLAGKRGWVKIKHERTADCAVIGYRLSNDGKSLGSLLLGLYDGEGALHYVGHTSSFDVATRRRLLMELEPLREGAQAHLESGRMPGGPSRWSRGKETEWVGLRPELVCEVTYDKLQGGMRFRHATGFRRWRPDRAPRDCRFDQIESVAQFDVAGIFPGRG